MEKHFPPSLQLQGPLLPGANPSAAARTPGVPSASPQNLHFPLPQLPFSKPCIQEPHRCYRGNHTRPGHSTRGLGHPAGARGNSVSLGTLRPLVSLAIPGRSPYPEERTRDTADTSQRALSLHGAWTQPDHTHSHLYRDALQGTGRAGPSPYRSL